MHGWSFQPKLRHGGAEAERDGSPGFDGRSCSTEVVSLRTERRMGRVDDRRPREVRCSHSLINTNNVLFLWHSLSLRS